MKQKTLLRICEAREHIDTLKPSISLANRMNAHLDILLVAELISPSFQIHGLLGDKSWEGHNADILEGLESQYRAAKMTLELSGLSASIKTVAASGLSLTSIVGSHAIYSDLVHFCGQPFMKEPNREAMFHGALFESGRPILLTDQSKMPLPDFKKVLLAWNGSAVSAKAMHQILPYLREEMDICILAIDVERNDGVHHVDSLAEFLGRKGLNVTIDTEKPEDLTTPQTILQKAEDRQDDLIVMGGYGHSRLSQWVFGSTTGFMLDHSKFPLFLAH